MNSRERTIRAIKCKKPDRIPIYLPITPWDSDIVASFSFPSWDWKPDKRFIPRSPSFYIVKQLNKGKLFLIDEFGCIWHIPGDETIGQVIDPRVLRTWDDLKKFKTPNKNNKGRWWMAKLLYGLLGKSRFRMGAVDNYFFERMHFLRGFENLLKDIKRETKKVIELGEKLADWYIWCVDQWAKIGADGIMTTDDWGTNHATFISPKDFDQIFKPLYQSVSERIHDHGMYFMLHSCGNIYDLIPNLIEAGVDCLQLDQPRLTGLDKLSEFGGKMSYCCVADISKVLPYKTPNEVELEVLEMVKKLGRFNGGLLGTIYADYTAIKVPKINIDANIRGFKRFGKYY